MNDKKNLPNVFGGEGLITEGVRTIATEGLATNGQQAARMNYDGASTKPSGQHQPRMTASFVSPVVPSLGKRNKK